MPVHCIVWAKEFWKLCFGDKCEDSMLFEDDNVGKDGEEDGEGGGGGDKTNDDKTDKEEGKDTEDDDDDDERHDQQRSIHLHGSCY